MYKILLLCFFLLGSTTIMSQEITSPIIHTDFNAALEISKKENIPLLAIFSADWCGYCDLLKSDVLKDNSITHHIICVVNVDTNKQLARSFKVRSMPTSIVFDDGKETKKKIGYKDKKDYLGWLNHE